MTTEKRTASNIQAVAIQMQGEKHLEAEMLKYTSVGPMCESCAKSNGPFAACVTVPVVLRSGLSHPWAKGACANCLWGNKPSNCSFPYDS